MLVVGNFSKIMSFSSYYMTFQNEAHSKFEVKKLIDIFTPITNKVRNDGLELFLDSMNYSFLSAELSQISIDNFSIERPCSFEEKYIYEFSKEVFLVLAEPDLDGFIVFNDLTIQHLPVDMKNDNHFFLVDNLEKFHNRFKIFPY